MDVGVYGTCDWCAREINYGNATVTVNRNIEQITEGEDANHAVVTVIQSDTLLTLCAECGNRLDPEELEEVLMAPIRSSCH